MRKISQAVLLVIAVISLIGFLVYKHKYERVVGVLRVMNTFGCQSECDNSVVGVSGSNIPRTMSTWQQIDDIYLYSAYWKYEHKHVVLLGLAMGSTKMPLNCLLWFEDDGDPVIGSFAKPTIRNDTEADEFQATTFTCKTDAPRRNTVPYAVSLASDDRFQATQSTAFIYIQPRRRPRKDRNGTRLAVCVLPQRHQSLSPQLLQEFIAYHAAIGITRFVIYDVGTSPAQIAQWRTVSDSNPLAFEFLPWNVPYLAKSALGDASLAVLQEDCIYRLSRTHSHITLLRANQFIVPRHHKSLVGFFEEEERKFGKGLGALFLEERHFCTDFRKAHVEEPIVVDYTLWVRPSGKDNPVYAFIRTDVFHSFWESGEPRFRLDYAVRKVHFSSANFHYYGPCLSGVSTDYAAVIYQNSKEDLIMGEIKKVLNY